MIKRKLSCGNTIFFHIEHLWIVIKIYCLLIPCSWNSQASPVVVWDAGGDGNILQQENYRCKEFNYLFVIVRSGQTSVSCNNLFMTSPRNSFSFFSPFLCRYCNEGTFINYVTVCKASNSASVRKSSLFFNYILKLRASSASQGRNWSTPAFVKND